MEKIINFSGLGVELGQSKVGLINSASFARQYFSILTNSDVLVNDSGDILQKEIFNSSKFTSVNQNEVGHLDIFNEIYIKTLKLLNEDVTLVNWGGDHSIALATVGAFINYYSDGYVIWIDAHADLNTPSSSITGNLHGMPISFLLNIDQIASQYLNWLPSYLRLDRLIYIGLRDLDPYEEELIKSLKIKNYSYEFIRTHGIETVSKEVETIVGRKPVHISFDIDSLDPLVAPATGVPVRHGLNLEEITYLTRECLRSLNLKSVDVVEVNPSLSHALGIDQTYIIAMNFLKTLLSHNNEGVTHDRKSFRDQAKCNFEMEWI